MTVFSLYFLFSNPTIWIDEMQSRMSFCFVLFCFESICLTLSVLLVEVVGFVMDLFVWGKLQVPDVYILFDNITSTNGVFCGNFILVFVMLFAFYFLCFVLFCCVGLFFIVVFCLFVCLLFCNREKPNANTSRKYSVACEKLNA